MLLVNVCLLATELQHAKPNYRINLKASLFRMSYACSPLLEISYQICWVKVKVLGLQVSEDGFTK